MKKQIDIEKWIDIEDYEGMYQVSSFGRVRSLDRDVKYNDGRVRHYKSKVLSQYLNNKGYMNVSLSANTEKKSFKVHRLTLQAFISNPDNLPQVNHINEDKDDNRVENLEWTTPKQNVNHGNGIERRAKSLSKAHKEGRMEKNYKAHYKPIIAMNLEMTEIVHIFRSMIEAEKIGFDSGGISMCCAGQLKTHKKLIWGKVI